jgi:Chaperone for flagella basal body P-ring formation
MSILSLSRRISKCLIVASVLLNNMRPSMASAASPAQPDAFRKAVVRVIESHLVSVGTDPKYFPAADQLEILASGIDPKADFSIQDLYWDGLRETLYFRMTCGPQKSCAPFLVRALVGIKTADALRQQLAPRQPGNFTISSNIHKANRCQQASLLVRAGRPATLLLRSGNMKLITPVITLECGTAGQQVRTRGRKTNKIFEAEVIGENKLAATF